MVVGRFFLIIPVLAIAGSMARKQPAPVTAGTFPTHTPLFAGLVTELRSRPGSKNVRVGFEDGVAEVVIPRDADPEPFVAALKRAGYRTLTTALDGPSERLRDIIERRCVGCHSDTPTFRLPDAEGPLYAEAPSGVTFDTPEQITARAARRAVSASTPIASRAQTAAPFMSAAPRPCKQPSPMVPPKGSCVQREPGETEKCRQRIGAPVVPERNASPEILPSFSSAGLKNVNASACWPLPSFPIETTHKEVQSKARLVQQNLGSSRRI